MLVQYDPSWKKYFSCAKQELFFDLNCHIENIIHIGSTSIEGMSAKPIIDIIVILNKDHDLSVMKKIGYQYKGFYNIPYRYFFSKKEPFSVHLHVVQNNHPFIDLNLKFLNYLQNHQDEINHYKDLKNNLVQKKDIFAKKQSCFSDYTLSKNRFIKSILKKASFDSLMINEVAHIDEVDFIKKYFCNDISNVQRNFVLYKGVEIIACAITNGIKILNVYFLNSNEEHKDFFVSFIEKYLAFKIEGDNIHF